MGHDTGTTGSDRTASTVLETQLEAGLHHGAQFAVYHGGEPVVNLADGIAGPTANGRLPTANT